MKKIYSIIIFCFLLFANNTFSQKDTIINGKKYVLADDKSTEKISKRKYLPSLDSTFIYKDKKYKYYNNWLSGGAGTYYNFTRNKKLGFALGVDYNFHIKYNYFQLGINLLGEQYGKYNNYHFHLGYGKRKENGKYHLAGFAGVSYTSGYQTLLVDSTVYIRNYNRPGIYIQLEGVKKITYDIGVGMMFFADVNQEQTIIGAKITLYFSGAYKGKKRR